jgi:hypothetical protein
MRNERIKQFAIEAGLVSASEGDIHANYYKFAKMIVDECGSIADECAEREITITPSAHMKIHFGDV